MPANLAQSLAPTPPPTPIPTAKPLAARYREWARAMINLQPQFSMVEKPAIEVRVSGETSGMNTLAITAQADSLLFYSAAGDLPIRTKAAEALCAFADMGSVFFCNSGAEANEHALKVAIQLTGRKKLVAVDGAFHGRTLLALSATD